MHSHLRAGRAYGLAALTIGAVALLLGALAPPAFASQTYTWSLTCSGEGGCNVSWNWLQNGAVIANPPSGSVVYNAGFLCAGPCSLSNSSSTNQYVQPGTANGMTATLQACVPVSGGTQCDTQTATQSFAPGSRVAVNLSASVKAKSTSQCFPGYPCGGSKQINEAAAFQLNS